ncbi:MAG TPA: hypothetical protein DCQ90_06455 [Erysipelotrichaceae bacterium]|nr:hypothetical protein [Erysipelotrichaceae bacterium]
MKPKFDTFKRLPSYPDGVCTIKRTSEEGVVTTLFSGLCFENRVLGYNRVFVAASVQVRTDRVIRTPMIPGVANHDILEIAGEGKYSIELMQTIYEFNPPSVDLTLKQLGMFS